MNADQELVAAARAGRPGAFERLVAEHQDLCWRVVYRMVRHPDDTRELCQETFLRVFQRLHQYRGDSRLKAWIASIAYSIALRHLERRRIPLLVERDPEEESRVEQVPDSADLEQSAITAQSDAALHAAIERLPPVQRTLLTLYHLDELTIPEISQATAMPEGTIKNYLFRARQKLRQELPAEEAS